MRSSSRAARAAIVLGALAVLAIPVSVVLPQVVSGLRLLQTLYVTVPVAVVLGLLAVGAARRARYAVALSVRPERAGPVRTARIVAWAGLYAGVTGAIALAVYGILRWAP
jgi:hypothetical protein